MMRVLVLVTAAVSIASPLRSQTTNAELAAHESFFFTPPGFDREGQPINTFVLERRSGRRSWRSRVSGARKLARLLRRNIVNSQVRVYKRGKLQRVDSFYTLVKTSKRKAA